MPVRRRLWTVAATAVFAFVAVACESGDQTSVEEVEDAGVGRLIVGENVRIDGQVRDRLGPRAITIGADETLVLSSEELDLYGSEHVLVTGTVVSIDETTLDEDLGVELDDEGRGESADLAVLASSVDVVESAP